MYGGDLFDRFFARLWNVGGPLLDSVKVCQACYISGVLHLFPFVDVSPVPEEVGEWSGYDDRYQGLQFVSVDKT